MHVAVNWIQPNRPHQTYGTISNMLKNWVNIAKLHCSYRAIRWLTGSLLYKWKRQPATQYNALTLTEHNWPWAESRSKEQNESMFFDISLATVPSFASTSGCLANTPDYHSNRLPIQPSNSYLTYCRTHSRAAKVNVDLYSTLSWSHL